MRSVTERCRSGNDPSPPVEPGVGVEWSLDPGDAAVVPVVRRQVVECLRGLAGPGADLSGAEMVVAELLANAVEHTTGPAVVSLRWDGAHPMLSVADLGPGLPSAGPSGSGLVPRLPEDVLADRGRGLYLVSRLALGVAVAPRRAGGTVVSVTLDLSRPC